MKVFSTNEVGEILQRISDSQINAELTWYDLEGFDYVIGDSLVGFKKTKAPLETNWCSVANVVSVLAYEAAMHFPESNFGEWYRENS